MLGVYAQVQPLLKNRTVLIYNVAFDQPMLVADCQRYILPELGARNWECAMEWYAQWVGERRYYGRSHRDWSYRWQPLNGGHSALSDCQAVLSLLHEMAEEEIESANQS